MDESELRLSLIDHLEPRAGGPEGLLLLVDEAHTLPLRLLEEIRLLTNLAQGGQSRVRLVLAGNLVLEERLNHPKLESFLQRIVARCYLQPLARDETIFYIQEQIRRCGMAADGLFTGDAQTAIHTATDGIPRLINQLCDHALLLAALGGHRQIDAGGIEEAWADLQQLPVPLHAPAAVGAASGNSPGVVEFGQLDGEPRPAAALADESLARLEAIDQGLELMRSDGSPEGVVSGTAADDFSPADASGTEVELIFHSAHDPFGGQWDQEEVVIDRFASLDDAALHNRRRATSAEAQAIGAAVTSATNLAEDATKPDDAADDLRRPSVTQPFDPASDPLLPDEAPHDLPARRATVSLLDLAQDDRDLIVVEEEPPATPPAGRTRRPEYRQLFSSLRNK
jgi:hypothetical protein